MKMGEIDLDYNELGGGYILEEDKVIRNKSFCFSQLDDDTIGFGLLLPKIKDIINKKGEVIGKTQELCPALLINKKPFLIDPENKLLMETYYK